MVAMVINYYGSATYSGNIILNGNVYFGYGGGSCVLVQEKYFNWSKWYFCRLVVFQNFTQQDSTSKVLLALTGTSQLFLNQVQLSMTLLPHLLRFFI